MKKVEVDDILEYASLGIWNFKIIIIIILSSTTQSITTIFYPIIYGELQFTCADDLTNMTIIDECKYYSGNNTAEEISCGNFRYHPSDDFMDTARSKFDLVCNRNSLPNFDISIIMLSQMFATTICTSLCDYFGRRPVFVLCLFINTVSSILYLFLPNVYLMFIVRFFDGAAMMGACVSGFMLLIECVYCKYRIVFITLWTMFYGIGMFLSGLASSLIPYWKEFVICRMIIPNIVLFSFSYFLIDESPKWLLQNDQFKKFKNVIKKLFDQNRTKMPQVVEIELTRMQNEASASSKMGSTSTNRSVKFWLLYRTPKTAMWMIIFAISWCANVLVYFGLVFGKDLFNLDLHVWLMLSGLVEIPGMILQIFIAARYGRRAANIICMLGCTGTLLMSTFTPTNGYWMYLIYFSACASKLFITATFGNIYVWNGEVMPTNLRAVGVGAGSFIGRLSGVPMKYVQDYLIRLWHPLPVILFATISFIAGVSSFFVPETLNELIPDNIEEYEAFGTEKFKKLKAVRQDLLRGKFNETAEKEITV